LLRAFENEESLFGDEQVGVWKAERLAAGVIRILATIAEQGLLEAWNLEKERASARRGWRGESPPEERASLRTAFK